MSRIAKNGLTIPEGVDVQINGKEVKAKGKLGELALKMVDEVSAKVEDGKVIVEKTAETKFANAMWATTWRLINNLCVGVSKGFERNLKSTGLVSVLRLRVRN